MCYPLCILISARYVNAPICLAFLYIVLFLLLLVDAAEETAVPVVLTSGSSLFERDVFADCIE